MKRTQRQGHTFPQRPRQREPAVCDNMFGTPSCGEFVLSTASIALFDFECEKTVTVAPSRRPHILNHTLTRTLYQLLDAHRF